MLRDESCHCTNVCKVLFQIFSRVITDLKISTYIGKFQFCFSAQVRYKTKGGLLDMIYNIMQIKMSQYGTMGMLVNTLSESFILSGATKNLLMGSRVSHVLKRWLFENSSGIFYGHLPSLSNFLKARGFGQKNFKLNRNLMDSLFIRFNIQDSKRVMRENHLPFLLIRFLWFFHL